MPRKVILLFAGVIGGKPQRPGNDAYAKEYAKKCLHKEEGELLLTHTRLQPGDRECQGNRKPFKRFPVLALAQFTWLKPGVNEIELAERIR